MIAKLEAPRERASEGDDRMRNENDTLCTRTGVVKKPSRYDNGKLSRVDSNVFEILNCVIIAM